MSLTLAGQRPQEQSEAKRPQLGLPGQRPLPWLQVCGARPESALPCGDPAAGPVGRRASLLSAANA